MIGRGRGSITIRFAVAALLLHSCGAIADPYRYDLRSRFIREEDPEEPPPGLDLKPRIDSALLFVN
jgi:hypothetical protein